MRRRRVLQAASALGTLGLAGCFGFGGGSSNPPPRQAEVYEQISANDGEVTVALEDDPEVESRAEIDGGAALSLGFAPPIGVAAAQKGGRGAGATGRGTGAYSGAPHNSHGRAIHHGRDDDDEWREDHADEIEEYDAAIQTVAIGYMGTTDEYSDDPPPVGPLDEWDQRWDDPEPDSTLSMSVDDEGWYRVGAELTSESGSHDFGWESVDFEVDESGGSYEVENPWQVSPRL